MTEVNCKHWRECGSVTGGCCSKGIYERPSFGVCNTFCEYNTSIDHHKKPKGEAFHKRVLKNVKSYIDAERSLANEGELDDAQYGARIKLCLTCEYLKQTYDDIGHCGACGCGISKRAALTVKGRMPRATCPKNKWATVQMKASEE